MRKLFPFLIFQNRCRVSFDIIIPVWFCLGILFTRFEEMMNSSALAMFCGMAMLTVSCISGCKHSEQSTNEMDIALQRSEAIRRVVTEIRRIVVEAKPKDESIGASAAALKNANSQLDGINTRGCPPDFVEAFIRFRGAGDSLQLNEEEFPKSLTDITITTLGSLLGGDFDALPRLRGCY